MNSKILKFTSVILVISVIICNFIITADIKKANDSLVLSDCTSGWSYGGNSTITYAAEGEKYLSVTASYGAMRKLSYNTDSVSLSEYEAIELSLRAANSADNSDMFLKILEAYKNNICLTAAFDNGAVKNYCREDMLILDNGDGWYRISVKLTEEKEALLKRIDFSILTDNTFDTSQPTVKYFLKDLKAVKADEISPKIEGAQVDRTDKSLRVLASMSKSDYEEIKKNSAEHAMGFLVVNSGLYGGVLSSGQYGADYLSGKPARFDANQAYVLDGDDKNLYFTLVLSDFYSSEMKNTDLSVRAYISYKTASGEEKIFFSNDDINGGYSLTWDKISSNASFKEMTENIKKINVIEDTSKKITVTPTQNGKRTVGKPYVFNQKYDNNDGLLIALYDVVKDFGAPVNSFSDSSAIIQYALNLAESKGGGVVYIPEGVYMCHSPITVPSGVTLRGEWQPPKEAAPASSGTVLVVKTGNISQNANAFINIKVGATVRNCTVIYPDYANGVFEEYSPTISQKLSGTNDSFNVINVTILGGSVGFDAAQGWSELHYVKNVYFSSFDAAIKINNVTDTGRLENINISPDYLINNGLYAVSAENKLKIRDYAYNNSSGIYIKRSDWEYCYDLNISGLKNGIVFDKYIDTQDNDRVRGSNGQFAEICITNCETAIDCRYTNAIGYAFSGLDISAQNSEYGINFGTEFMANFEISNMNISGKISKPIYCQSQNNGKITVTNSEFNNSNLDNYDVEVIAGSISVQQCFFNKKIRHIKLSDSIGAASVLGCRASDKLDIKYSSANKERILIDGKNLDLPAQNFTHTYKKHYPTAASASLYNIADYGAVSGKDSTAALKNALAAAQKTGGIVYVPQGEYYINDYITVPSGVEIRGIYDAPTHPVTKGSVLMTEIGKNDENGRAFISLEAASGINGISIYYTDQDYVNFVPYSWSVRSLGKDCWAINSVFINSYNALDFGTNPSDNHYISYVSGSPLRRGVFIGNNSSNGWVENVQFNPHYWKRASISVRPTENAGELNNKINYTLKSLIFGYNKSEHVLGTFGYGGASLLNFVEQSGKGTNGVFIGHGSDGCRTALTVDELDTVVMINSELVSMNYTEDMHHIVVNENATGTLALFNSQIWGHALDASIVVKGGNLLVSQMFYYNIANTVNIAEVSGGNLCLTTSILPIKQPHYVLKQGGTMLSKANFVKLSGEVTPTAENKKITFSNSDGCLSYAFDWWM